MFQKMSAALSPSFHLLATRSGRGAHGSVEGGRRIVVYSRPPSFELMAFGNWRDRKGAAAERDDIPNAEAVGSRGEPTHKPERAHFGQQRESAELFEYV